MKYRAFILTLLASREFETLSELILFLTDADLDPALVMLEVQCESRWLPLIEMDLLPSERPLMASYLVD